MTQILNNNNFCETIKITAVPRFNIIFEKNNREKADLVSSGERIAHECGFNRIVCEALATRDLSGGAASLDELEDDLHLSNAAGRFAAAQLERVGLFRRIRKPGDRKRGDHSAEDIATALRRDILKCARTKMAEFEAALLQAGSSLAHMKKSPGREFPGHTRRPSSATQQTQVERKATARSTTRRISKTGMATDGRGCRPSQPLTTKAFPCPPFDLALKSPSTQRPLCVCDAIKIDAPIKNIGAAGSLELRLPRLPLDEGRHRIGAQITVGDMESDFVPAGTGRNAPVSLINHDGEWSLRPIQQGVED